MKACYVAGCGVDCHAMNFQPSGVFVQALRNTSLKLRGWAVDLRLDRRATCDERGVG